MNRQPYGSPPKWWAPKLSLLVIRWSRGWRSRQLRAKQKIEQVIVQRGEIVRQARDKGHGILLTPNHAVHYDSAALYLAADQLDLPLHILTAWQVFGMSRWWEQLFMQGLGCFSIDRESVDRQAFKQSVHVLQESPYPLVIFPEGDIYHVADRVTPFREGAAAIALSAAKRANRPISVIPCGIKFWYLDDPTPNLKQVMGELEQRLLLRPQPDGPLTDRIYRLAEAVLSLKEIDYLGRPAAGDIPARIDGLSEHVLRTLEARYSLAVSGQGAPERAKALRQKIIQSIESETSPPSAEQLRQLQSDMDDVFFVMQLYSYPGDYLSHTPSLERVSETLDKFEEDILGRDLPSVRGRRLAQIRFGPPLELSQSDARRDVSGLTREFHDVVQRLMDEMIAQGRPAAT